MTINLEAEIFVCAAAASAAVEVLRLYQYYESGRRRLPARYRKLGFWIVRLLLAIVAGGLAVAYGVGRCVPALHIGASAPLILQALALGAAGGDSKVLGDSADWPS